MSLRPLTAEQAYVGSLMWLDLDAARPAHGWATEEDLSSPALQLIHRLIGELVDADIAPDPVAVLSLAIDEQHATGENQIHVLTGHLCQLYDHRATNPASVRWYASQTLEQAFRRRTVEMATRLAQVAEHADLDELERLTRSEQAAVDAVRHRRGALMACEVSVLAA